MGAYRKWSYLLIWGRGELLEETWNSDLIDKEKNGVQISQVERI